MVSESFRTHTDKYNEVMTEEIKRRYGAGILDRLAGEASEAHAVVWELY
jgi:hypothetical protein